MPSANQWVMYFATSMPIQQRRAVKRRRSATRRSKPGQFSPILGLRIRLCAPPTENNPNPCNAPLDQMEFAIGTKLLEGVRFSHSMVRIKALILILALIVTPVASLCATPSSMLAQCSRFCPMHGKAATHPSAGESDDMDCHHGKSPEDCVMKSCGHTLDFGVASPLPPAVLCPQVKLIAIRINGLVRLRDGISSLMGFHTPPVQPPRA
jgi:hypothetical protein